MYKLHTYSAGDMSWIASRQHMQVVGYMERDRCKFGVALGHSCVSVRIVHVLTLGYQACHGILL